jgi:hypothetical protein
MNQMTEKQSLEILKSALDLSTSKGVFQNLDSTFAVVQAFNVISEKLLKKEDDVAAG